MVDVVTSQVLEVGPRNLAMRFTNLSDGTGESGVVKVNATDGSLGWVVQGQTIVPGTSLHVLRVRYAVRNMKVRVQWQATTAQDILLLSGFGTLNFEDTGGIQNPGTVALPGATGSIQFSTVGAVANASYFVEIMCTKGTGYVVSGTKSGIELENLSGFWLWSNNAVIDWG